MTPAQQLKRWVAGRPQCPNSRGECCPDFSCCRPKLLWPESQRVAFRDASQEVRERMMLGALVGMIEGDGYIVETGGGK